MVVHVHDTAERAAGMTSIDRGILRSMDGPLLVTTIEYWIDVPATSVTLPSVLVIDRSAFGIDGRRCRTRCCRPGWGRSIRPALRPVAVLTIVPVADGATVPVSVNDTLPPTARSTVVAMSPLIGPAVIAGSTGQGGARPRCTEQIGGHDVVDQRIG